ncbi:hypothetical protein [Vibrio splendidus]|uniref:hypothetical protein n=1 Tax=Vibrio splendidus TaxID=29497 RepID=UPI003D0FC2FF
MTNNKQSKHLFDISSRDLILREKHNQMVMADFFKHFININKISMTTYRAGCAITEFIIHYELDKIFLLTIHEGEFNIQSITGDDIRIAHKEISLPDVTDIMVFVTRLAHHAHVSPQLALDSDSAEVLVFSS